MNPIPAILRWFAEHLQLDLIDRAGAYHCDLCSEFVEVWHRCPNQQDAHCDECCPRSYDPSHVVRWCRTRVYLDRYGRDAKGHGLSEIAESRFVYPEERWGTG